MTRLKKHGKKELINPNLLGGISKVYASAGGTSLTKDGVGVGIKRVYGLEKRRGTIQGAYERAADVKISDKGILSPYHKKRSR